jgi:arylsulfatase A-like enzyme
VYETRAAEYRRLYYRLHAQVDTAIVAVRREVTNGSDDAVLVLTADHGELLGAHGGLHQKWFNLYDEATRVPFVVARTGALASSGRTVDQYVTSHVDLVPTLLAAASVDVTATAAVLAERFSELHPFPGHDLMPVVDGAATADVARAVYLMTRDNILEGDTRGSAAARAFGLAADPPDNMVISVPADTGSSFEAIVARDDGHWWKLVRTYDDPETWTQPGVRHLTSSGAGGDRFRDQPLPDEWELYDLTDDPIESQNQWQTADAGLRERLVARLQAERERCVPPRCRPWPYVARRTGEALHGDDVYGLARG